MNVSYLNCNLYILVFWSLHINQTHEGEEMQSYRQFPCWMHKHNMKWNKEYSLHIVLTVMLRIMCEKHGKYPNCEIQVKGRCLKLIHKPPTLYVWVEARPTTKMIHLPHKPTCIPTSYSHISNSHTHINKEEENFGKCWCKS